MHSPISRVLLAAICGKSSASMTFGAVKKIGVSSQPPKQNQVRRTGRRT